jgi:hypothetical protein
MILCETTAAVKHKLLQQQQQQQALVYWLAGMIVLPKPIPLYQPGSTS